MSRKTCSSATFALVNEALAERPGNMAVGIHLCHGNYKGQWMAAGGYAPVAELVFGGLNVDAFFLEYDSERAGGFEPLAAVGPEKTVVLGLVTTKTPALESADLLKQRIEGGIAIRAAGTAGDQPAMRLRIIRRR